MLDEACVASVSVGMYPLQKYEIIFNGCMAKAENLSPES